MECEPSTPMVALREPMLALGEFVFAQCETMLHVLQVEGSRGKSGVGARKSTSGGDNSIAAGA